MSLRTLSYILGHPLNQGHKGAAIARYLRWQIGSRLRKGKKVVPFVGPTRLAIRRGMTSATGNLYCGLQEFEEMAFVLHALRAGDCFFDVGANVGVYSVLAAGVSGADVMAFEPSPATYQDLVENMDLNQLATRVRLHNVALGGKLGELRFTTNFGTINHVVSASEAAADSVVVKVERLDDLAGGTAPLVMKIDVEGFETEVIRGAPRLLADPRLCGILMEFNGSGTRYGYDEKALQETIVSHGFGCFRYEPFRRRLLPLQEERSDNILFVRNLPLMSERVAAAPKVTVNGVTF
jgi:FkbM family methyltransferase